MATLPRGRGGGDARDHGRQRGVGQLRVQLPGSQRARVRRQRTELAVGHGLAVDQEHLGVAAEDAEPAAEQLQLARRLGGDRRAGGAARGERVIGQRVGRLFEERVAHRGGEGRRERIDHALGGGANGFGSLGGGANGLPELAVEAAVEPVEGWRSRPSNPRSRRNPLVVSLSPQLGRAFDPRSASSQ